MTGSTLNNYSTFRVQVVDIDLPEDGSYRQHVAHGILSMLDALRATGLVQTVSIAPNDGEVRMPTVDLPERRAKDFSLWARYDHGWRFRVVGASALEDLAVELFDLLRENTAQEIRICPPGGIEPGQVR